MQFPLTVPAIRVIQPLGVFYVAVLPASVLLTVAYSDTLSASLRASGTGYDLTGTQRSLESARLRQIADFIDRADASFPNTIILAANFRMEDGLLEDDEAVEDGDDLNPPLSSRWTIEEKDGRAMLTIPSKKKLAAIIDGQHRLFAFANAENDRLTMELICSVFLDLPKPIQAQLFATINSTQKPVSKSLTYELFGYNLEEEAASMWAPDKLSVFLTRRLGTDDASPLRGRIIVAPLKDETFDKAGNIGGWKVSTAAVVEGLMRLITTNPRRDTSDLLSGHRKSRKEIEGMRKDQSPLRDIYLNNDDVIIYTLAVNFLSACDDVFWRHAPDGSFITRTVGVQALFDILRDLAGKALSDGNISVSYFKKRLNGAAKIDFSLDHFRNASAGGRALIRRTIKAEIGLEAGGSHPSAS